MSIKEKIKLEPTVAILTHFKSEDYSVPIMLSELIDNSISSWEKLDESTRSNLKIKIIFISDCDDSSAIISQKSEIIIQDNAAGMTYEEIRKAAPLYSTENKGKEDLNQYGIGLKSAIGWFGEDAFIYSKTKDDHMINYLEFRTSDKSAYELFAPMAAELDIKNKEDNKDFVSIYYKKKDIFIAPEKSGTTIVIKNINDDISKFSYLCDDDDKRNALFAFLGWKYKYYIKQKGLELYFFDEKHENGASISSKSILYKIGNFEIKPWKLSDFKEDIKNRYKKNNSAESENIANAEIAMKFKEFTNDIEAIEKDESSSSILKEVCRLILDDKPVVINEPIKLSNSPEEKKLTYGIISSSTIKYTIGLNDNKTERYAQFKSKYGYDKLQGVSTYHHDRGIDIGPWINKDYWKKKQPQTISFAENRKTIDGESTPIRLYGEIHLNDFSTEINKTVLLWNDSRSDLTNRLKEIWENTFKKILAKIIKVEKICDDNDNPKKLNSSSIDKINENISQKMQMGKEDTIVEYTNRNGVNTWKYISKYKDKRYIFVLTEEKNKSNKPFICKLVNEDNESIKYSISYDFFHSIWSPININATSFDSRIVAHPIIVTLALAQWIINDKQNNSPNFLIVNKKNRKDIDLFDIIDEIVKDWREFNDNEWL
ncbi:MAG: ATP-binding protein [Malacoplasma sp.]